MYCVNHSETTAVTACIKCGAALCEQCTIRVKDGATCKRCLEAAALPKGAGGVPPRYRKSPALAAVLSLLPGLGQAYVGYYVIGFINILVVAAVITVLESHTGMEPFFGLFLSFFWIFNMIDAAKRAQLYNRRGEGAEVPKMPTDSPLVGGILLVIFGLLLTLEITFDMDLSAIEDIWPLAVLGGGAYLLWRYYKTRKEMDQG